MSEQLNATPKKVIEALIKSVNLKDEHELLQINKHINGRKFTKEKPVEPEKTIEAVKPEESAKLEQLEKLEEQEESVVNKEDNRDPLQYMLNKKDNDQTH